MLAELTSKKPKNLKGELSYKNCFEPQTRELYKEAWEYVLHSLQQENMLKNELMKQPSFDVAKAFKSLTPESELTREHLFTALQS